MPYQRSATELQIIQTPEKCGYIEGDREPSFGALWVLGSIYLWISIFFLPSICREPCLPLFVAPDSLIDCSHCICHRISSSIPISHAYCCGCQMIIHSDFLQFLKSGLFLPLIAPHLCILLPAAFLSIPILSIMLWTKPPVGKIAFSVSKASHCPFKIFGLSEQLLCARIVLGTSDSKTNREV